MDNLMVSKIIVVLSCVFLFACAPSGNDAAVDAAKDSAGQASAAAADAIAGAQNTAAEAAVTAGDLEALVAAADPDRGKRMYIFCQSCHTLNEGGMNKVGPNLHGIVNSPAGAVEGFVYSEALTNAGLTWDVATLDKWLQRPAELVPGTTMIFAGVQTQEQRAELIAYLVQQSNSE